MNAVEEYIAAFPAEVQEQLHQIRNLILKEAAQAEEQAEAEDTSPALREFNAARRYAGKRVTRSTSKRTTKSDDSFGGAIASVVIKELKGTTGRRIVRGILGGLFKGR